MFTSTARITVTRNFGNFLRKFPHHPTRKMSDSPVQMLDVGASRKIAYRLFEGNKTSSADPTIVFVPGFMSTMEGFKAQTLEKFCQQEGRRYVRFDFEGVGRSPGKLSDILVGTWIDDLRCIMKKLVPNKALLIGSSMGGWFSIKLAGEMSDKVAGLLLVAPAINFFKYYYDFFYKTLSDEEKAVLDSGKMLVLKKNFGEIFLRKGMMEESMNHHLDLSKPIRVDAPVRILHGVLDGDVPYKQSLKLMEVMTSKDVDVTFRKNGGHQMSEPQDLELLIYTLRDMLRKLEQPKSSL